MKIPASITQGDSVTWLDDATQDNLGNSVTSSAWTLKYEIRATAQLTLTATPSGPGWSTTISAAQSATLAPGVNYWQAYVTKGPDRITLGTGQIIVAENLAPLSGAYDGRSQAEKDLDAVVTAIRAMVAGGAVQEYAIQGRSLRKIPMADLLVLESRLKGIVARERKAESMANGTGNPHKLLVRFNK